jgi:citrate lyase subunit beta / citryl-CoA lyase
MLFVPGHKASWADKGVASGADALILDLEDSVPEGEKAETRATVRATIERLAREDVPTDVWVRPNSYSSGLFSADVEAVTVPGLAGLFLPKVFSAEDIIRIDAVLSHIEQREGIEDRSVRLIVSFESALSMENCSEIAKASPRVSSLVGGTGPNADVSRVLGFEFTPEGLESLYLRSRILLAARAADLNHPITGLWQDIHDIEGLRRFAEDGRRLGYRGMVCIHPSHVGPLNEIFTPSKETVDFYRRMIEAFHAAEAQGSAAVDFEGQHIDIAHVKTAQEVLNLVKAVQRQ